MLRRVEAGETFEVTDRGRPVAVLGPPRARSPLDRLRESGDLEPAQEEMNDLPHALKLCRGEEPPSKMLARLRRDER